MLIVNGPQKTVSCRLPVSTPAARTASLKAVSNPAPGVSTCQRSHSSIAPSSCQTVPLATDSASSSSSSSSSSAPGTAGGSGTAPPAAATVSGLASNPTSGVVNTQINASMTIRRILQLYEQGECREAALVISRLPYGTIRAVILDLPVDVFVEAMPGSLPILDALYAKVFFAGRDLLAFGFKFLHPENVVSSMIRMFALGNVYQQPGAMDALAICKKLLKVILLADPSLRKQLVIKKALLDRAVEGMGHHGLVGTSNDALMNLHEALKLEFERVISQYRSAINKIEELSLAKEIKDGGPVTRSLSQGPAPTFSSHQRLLSLKQEEIQERLNKNRALLCALEPCFRTNHSLQILLAILQKRIDYDKETLFQFGQLRKEFQANEGNSTNGTASSSLSGTMVEQQRRNSVSLFERDAVVAPVLMRFSHGCAQVLQLLKEIQIEGGGDGDDEEMLVTTTTTASQQITTTTHHQHHHHHNQQQQQQHTNNHTQPLQQQQQHHPHHHHHHHHHHGQHHQQGQQIVSSANIVKQSSPTNISATLDDCSDISGYHSDSEGSPTALRSPRSAANGPTSDISGSENGIVNSAVSGGGVSIMTGSADGTTLLNGQVTVNSGAGLDSGSVPTVSSPSSTSSSCSGYRSGLVGGRQAAAGSAVCRIELRADQVPEVPDDYLRCELAQARARIEQLEAGQASMQRKLANQTTRLASLGLAPGVEYSRLDESNRTNAIVRSFERLYSQDRTNALDALEQNAELCGCDELKQKLLFSCLVLTYRSTATKLKNLRSNIAAELQIDSWSTVPSSPLQSECSTKPETDATFDTGCGTILQQLESSLLIYLRTTSASFDLTPNVKEVHKQICDTLFDYPCLLECPELIEFIQECARISWRLHLEPGHFRLDIDARHFRPDWHCRVPEADPTSDSIKCYVWPTIFQESHCVHRGRVIT